VEASRKYRMKECYLLFLALLELRFYHKCRYQFFSFYFPTMPRRMVFHNKVSRENGLVRTLIFLFYIISLQLTIVERSTIAVTPYILKVLYPI
jgi:hypothetical protein